MRWALPLSLMIAHYKNESNIIWVSYKRKVSGSHCLDVCMCDLPACERLIGLGLLRCAVIWVGHNLLLLGGELGRSDNKEFDPVLGISIADV